MNECDICKLQHQHGGKCGGKYSNTPCILFEEDPRGSWKREEFILITPIGYELPPLMEKSSDFMVHGAEKSELIIYRILSVGWKGPNKETKGQTLLKLKIDVGYWSNENETPESTANREAEKRRSQFKLIKATE